jgi:hypothetical protein
VSCLHSVPEDVVRLFGDVPRRRFVATLLAVVFALIVIGVEKPAVAAEPVRARQPATLLPPESDESLDAERSLSDSPTAEPASYLPDQPLDLPGVAPRDDEWTEPGEVFHEGGASDEADVVEEPLVESPAAQGPPPGPRRWLTDHNDAVTVLFPRDGFSVMEYDARTAVVIPLFLGGPPPKLGVGFGATTIDSPDGFDLPDTLYNVQLELRWLRPVNEWMAVDTAVGGAWFTDFNTPASRGFRVTGRVLLFMTHSETLKSAVGVVYLGRDNLVAVPAVGLIYSPREDVRYEVMIPRPRAMWRLGKSETHEQWGYLGAELFGGNNWAIDHADGREDVFIYSDYRLLAGFEYKATAGPTLRAEAGFVFAREARFEVDPRELEPGSTGFARLSFVY